MALSVTLCLLAGLSAPAVTSAGSTSAAPGEFRLVRVEVEGLDEAEIFAALRLRMHGLRVERHDNAPPDLYYVYLQVARDPSGALNLRVITPDGRAFDRSLVIDPANELRVAASTAANLIFAAEQGVLTPDRDHVPIPPAHATVAAPQLPPEVPAEAPAPPAPHEPAPAPRRAPAVAPVPVSPPPGRWEWAMSTHGAAALSIGPPRYGERIVGLGGGLGAELRAPRGPAFVLELRGLGRRDAPLGLARLRIAVGAGYVLRHRRFELPLLLALAVEPWRVTSSSGATVMFDGAVTSARPQFGAYLRTTPSLRFDLDRGALSSLRIGPRVELGGGFLVYDGPVVTGLADGTGAPHFRLGGLELALGVELALYFARPTSPARATAEH